MDGITLAPVIFIPPQLPTAAPALPRPGMVGVNVALRPENARRGVPRFTACSRTHVPIIGFSRRLKGTISLDDILGAYRTIGRAGAEE